jgi:hypothetical protein
MTYFWPSLAVSRYVGFNWPKPNYRVFSTIQTGLKFISATDLLNIYGNLDIRGDVSF